MNMDMGSSLQVTNLKQFRELPFMCERKPTKKDILRKDVSNLSFYGVPAVCRRVPLQAHDPSLLPPLPLCKITSLRCIFLYHLSNTLLAKELFFLFCFLGYNTP